MNPDLIPTAESIKEAAERIRPWVHRTPVLTCGTINQMLGVDLFFKCENFQKIGAFKIRGGSNAALQLSPRDLEKGLATHSSGNHAQAIAVAARNLGVAAYIVMPSNSPQVKIDAVRGYGAEIILCAPNLQAREDGLKEVIERTGAIFIPSYDHYHIIEGQATAAMELLEDYNDLDIVMAPVGGGGLLAGTALATHYFSSHTQVIAGEPKGADDAWQSFKERSFVPSVNPQTIADGLLTSVGERNLSIILAHVSDIVTVDEPSIVLAMKLVWERMKMIIEPSSAVPLAVVMNDPQRFKGKKVGIIISGGNVDLEKLPF